MNLKLTYATNLFYCFFCLIAISCKPTRTEILESESKCYSLDTVSINDIFIKIQKAEFDSLAISFFKTIFSDGIYDSVTYIKYDKTQIGVIKYRYLKDHEKYRYEKYDSTKMFNLFEQVKLYNPGYQYKLIYCNTQVTAIYGDINCLDSDVNCVYTSGFISLDSLKETAVEINQLINPLDTINLELLKQSQALLK